MSTADESAFETASGAPTVREADERPVEDGVLHLIVMGANLFSMHRLPEQGAVSIGRDETDDVRIDEPNASRHHARLHVGPVLEIEDLGSTNGTRLRGGLLAPGQRTAVLPGEAISIGWATLMIQRRRPTRARAQAADARVLRRPPGRGVRQGGDVRARVRGHAPARRARNVVGDDQRHRVAAGAIGRPAGVVRPRRIRAHRVRARQQEGVGSRRQDGRQPRLPGHRRAHRDRVFSGRRALRRRADRARVRARAGAQRVGRPRRPRTSAAVPRCGACTCWRSGRRRPTSTC